ncbi:MAG TPA: hypothetical protein DEP23_06595 [Ruminococcaceae bacterium]|nr:hypothetical protein [Oscillospiraceae bacterium]
MLYSHFTEKLLGLKGVIIKNITQTEKVTSIVFRFAQNRTFVAGQSVTAKLSKSLFTNRLALLHLFYQKVGQ